MDRIVKRNVLIFAGLACVGCGLDLWTKTWIFDRLGMPEFGNEWVLWDRAFALTTSLNEGALFSFGQGFALGFAALSFVAMAGIAYWLVWQKGIHDLVLVIAMGLIMGGIWGNLYDRLGLPGLKWNYPPRLGEPVYAVRDWLYFRLKNADGKNIFNYPVFNLADCYLVCGAGLLFLQSFRTPAKATDAKIANTSVIKPVERSI